MRKFLQHCRKIISEQTAAEPPLSGQVECDEMAVGGGEEVQPWEKKEISRYGLGSHDARSGH